MVHVCLQQQSERHLSLTVVCVRICMIMMQSVQVGLLDRLAKICPKGLDTHIFANSGSEVVENAIKMARAHTKKTNIICFDVRHLLA